jgi:acetyl esterase
LLVVFGATDATCRTLCAMEHLVLAIPEGTTLHDATLAVEWAAEHAADLGADSERLLVGGEGLGASIAAGVVQHAREQGWPPFTMVPIHDPNQF